MSSLKLSQDSWIPASWNWRWSDKMEAASKCSQRTMLLRWVASASSIVRVAEAEACPMFRARANLYPPNVLNFNRNDDSFRLFDRMYGSARWSKSLYWDSESCFNLWNLFRQYNAIRRAFFRSAATTFALAATSWLEALCHLTWWLWTNCRNSSTPMVPRFEGSWGSWICPGTGTSCPPPELLGLRS